MVALRTPARALDDVLALNVVTLCALVVVMIDVRRVRLLGMDRRYF